MINIHEIHGIYVPRKNQLYGILCTKYYSGQLALLLIVIAIGREPLMLQVHDDVNVPVWNLLAVESVFG